MTKRKTTDRKDVLKAIKNEPLATGNWVNESGFSYPNQKKCDVCAVGAVLRQAGFSNYDIGDFGEDLMATGEASAYGDKKQQEKLIRSYLDRENFLHALSIKFEGQANRTGTGKRTRDILMKFVKENFPKRIKLEHGLEG